MTWLYLAASVPVVLLQFANLWLLSKGRLREAYRVGLVVYSGYLGIETTLALTGPGQWPILVFNLVNVWAIAMNVRGLIRLHRASQACQ